MSVELEFIILRYKVGQGCLPNINYKLSGYYNKINRNLVPGQMGITTAIGMVGAMVVEAIVAQVVAIVDQIIKVMTKIIIARERTRIKSLNTSL